MHKSKMTRRLALCAALTGTIGTAMINSAHADPKQYTALIGVGSDTVQDVMNAYAGATNGTNYTPLQSSAATGSRQLISFDAIPPAGVSGTCITPKLGGPTFTRPNGSSAGRRALSRAIDGTGYGEVTCGGPIDVSGQVNFARSSAGPAAGDVGTALTYIPFGRDAVSFATYRATGGAAVTTLTRAQLTSLFTTGPQVIAGVRIVPCGIQTSSGTYTFWNTVTTATATQEATATAECNAFVATGRAEENDGTALKARGDLAAAGDQVIIGFSAASFIAKSNGVAPGAPPAGVGIGSVSNNGSGVNLGSPVSGVAPNLNESATFYGDATFGRNVYTVWSTPIVTGIGNNDVKSLVVGATSALCAAGTTRDTFGFLASTSCGSTALQGSLIAGQL